MSTLRKAANATSIIMLATVFTKITGFLRETMMASRFGTGMSADSYFMANIIPMMMFTILATTLGTAFIPIFTDVLMNQSKEKAFDLASNVINTILIIAVIIAVVGVIFAPQIVSLIASGFDGEKLALTVQLTRLMFPLIVFIISANLFAAMLQSLNEFGVPAIAPLFFNVVIMAVLAFFVQTFGVQGLAMGTVVAALFQAGVQYPVLWRKGYRHRFYINLKDPALQKMAVLTLPMLLGSTLQQATVTVDRIMASKQIDGSISALNYANKVNTLALGLFGASIVLVIFPYLSKFAAQDDMDRIKRTLKAAVNVVLIIMMPVTVGFIVLRYPIVRFLFERGEFDAKATDMTAVCLLFYSIGLTAIVIRDIMSRVFYSLKDTKTPMINGMVGVVLNIILIILLTKSMSFAGLAFSTSITYIITLMTLGWKLYKKIGDLGAAQMLLSFLKTLSASIIMGVTVHFLYQTLVSVLPSSFIGQALSLFSTISLGALLYFILCYFMKFEEINMGIQFIQQTLQQKLKKA